MQYNHFYCNNNQQQHVLTHFYFHFTSKIIKLHKYLVRKCVFYCYLYYSRRMQGKNGNHARIRTPYQGKKGRNTNMETKRCNNTIELMWVVSSYVVLSRKWSTGAINRLYDDSDDGDNDDDGTKAWEMNRQFCFVFFCWCFWCSLGIRIERASREFHRVRYQKR